MDKQLLDKSLENFFLNSNIQIDFGNFFIAILVSLILAYIVKLTYIKVGRALNDKDYFSDTFIPLAPSLNADCIALFIAILYDTLLTNC